MTLGRITDQFQQLKQRKQKALICYLMAGDPTLEATFQAVNTLLESGADLIELGFPFSDPLADGPTIQEAAQRALKNPFTLQEYFSLVARIRQRHSAPLLLMTYFNILCRYGIEKFVSDSAQAGLDGMIIPDLPAEEADEILDHLGQYPVDLVPLAAPTTPLERIAYLTSKGSGFLYYVSRTGTTGARDDLPDDLSRQLERVVSASHLPVAVGFGISRPQHAQQIGQYADGVVIGSALVKRLGAAKGVQDGCSNLKEFLEPIARVMHETSTLEETK